MNEHAEQNDERLAAELAARLDAGLLTPAEDDSPELKALLATHARLQTAVEEPSPALYARIRQAMEEQPKEQRVEQPRKPHPLRERLAAWQNRDWLAPAFYALTVLVILLGFGALLWVDTIPQRVDDQQTVVLGQPRLVPGSDAAVRVVVQDLAERGPVAGALVRVSLQPEAGSAIPLFEGQTDETGSLPVRFAVPGDVSGEASLVVESQSAAGRDRVQQSVSIERDYRLLLSSDKPLYQPGQTIHMRVLALSSLDLTPARGATVDFLVEDPKGNKVFRQSVTASEFGIAAADFVLGSVVNQGNYRLSASIGDGASGAAEKSVEVKPYVLPKFGVKVSTERSYYLPGERVEGVVEATYFYGKAVAGGQVQIAGSVWDVERSVFLDLRGETDENGVYRFAFDLPDYFAASGLESGQAQFALEVTVVDQAEHPEQTSSVLPIAEQPLVIEAVAESGTLRPGVENVIYILTSYPDGRPAPARVQVAINQQAAVPSPTGQAVPAGSDGERASLSTGKYGLASYSFVPEQRAEQYLSIGALDETGLSARRTIRLEAEEGADSVLLRADRATYVVGETMHLLALTPIQSGSIYLDIVKSGQTLSTRSAPVEAGRAEFVVDASPDLFGTLELHAYKVLLDGTIVRDTRLVVVDEPRDIHVGITADKDSYLPGEAATLDFQTRDGQNPEEGVQTALGLAIVDESVFALQSQDPGFARLYFLLEQELMEPRYQIKEFELPAAIPVEEAPIRATQDEAAKATWADVPVLAAADPVNSHSLKVVEAAKAQRDGFDQISQASAVALALIPPAMLLLVLAFWQAGTLRLTVGRWAIALVVLVILGPFLMAALAFLVIGVATISEEAAVVLLVLIGAGVLLTFLRFMILAWVRSDTPARVLAQLTLVWIVLLVLLGLSAGQGNGPSTGWAIAAVAAFLLIPVAYVLFAQGRRAEKLTTTDKPGPGLGAGSALSLMVVLALLVTFVGGCGAALEPGELFLGLQSTAPTIEPAKEATAPEAGAETGAEPPRLRQYFPETLYWAPEVLTDEGGHASLQVPLADSITTWRLTALASSQDGRLGFATRGLRVFQDFFVDIDLPAALTQDDEISIPVGVFNYLPEAQQVRLEVEPGDWFELLGAGEQTLTIAANDIEVVYFPIRVLKFGQQGFQVTAWGEKISDAIRRQVAVVPNGQETLRSESNWLRESTEVAVDIPVVAVPGASSVEVKIYPGAFASAVEGLEKILRLPYG
jgi:5-hydroxyisourate hydrolase-like protein (transthyretin family)